MNFCLIIDGLCVLQVQESMPKQEFSLLRIPRKEVKSDYSIGKSWSFSSSLGNTLQISSTSAISASIAE